MRVPMFGKGTERRKHKTQKKDREVPKPNFASPSFRILWAASKQDLTKSALSNMKNVSCYIARCPKKW